MGNLLEEFRTLQKHSLPDKGMLVPLLNWCSGNEPDIELCQKINKRFFKVDKGVLISELALGCKLKHFIAYPKGIKNDEKLDFFYNDLCKYFKWTRTELEKNIDVLNIEELKEIIATAYGYDQKQRRILHIKKLKVNEGVRKKRQTKNRIPKKTLFDF